MARIKGREIVVELLDAVEKLQATSAEHSELLAEMARDAADTTAHLSALTALATHTARRANELSQRMDELSQRMDELSQRMDEVSQRMETTSQLMGELAEQSALSAQRLTALELDSHRALENARRSAELGRVNQTGLGEVARLLGRFAAQASTRFDSIEDRLTKVERKVG